MCIKRVDIKETPCPQAGYVRNAKGVCVDVDECASGTAKCGDNQYCINTDGYYACFRSCPYGYKAVGKTCLDIDECAISNPCQKNYKCVNMKGYYRCQLISCDSGFELKGDRCVDIDECSRGLHNCGAKYTCKNNNGGFRCQLSACIRGFRLSNGQCLDINECVETPSICGRGTCYNTYGAFSCNCFAGFQFKSETSKCEDIDECKRSPGICEAGCMNTVGSYKCSCPAGYRSFGNNCEDIDECAVSKNRCPANHVCVNEFGSFTCINATCPNQYYIQRSPYECRLYCPGNHGACSDLVIRSIKWRTQKFRKAVDPRGFTFQYSLRVSTYLKVQINFSLVSGNENGEFFLQRLNENTVDLINIKKLVGPKKYTLRLDTDVMFKGKVSSKFVYFIYLSLSKYNF
ncbi:fibulin-1-like [Rhopilema esculentum]|uniref:fibulin-1-like n=1 Tax=Rhopilema esculentum TaxID=499914 RepID=UPI0031CEAFA5